MKKFLKKHMVEIILCLILLAGLCLILYPSISDWWNSFHQSRAIASYVEDVENTSEEERQECLEAAHAYNRMLSQAGNSFILSEEEERKYRSLLDVSGTGIMGYIRIPSIAVDLPVYHGTDESVLQIAVGHIAGSSLPVGGSGTHCLLSGHRGLPSAKLFTDLDQLVEGDVFLLMVLGETLTYQVDQIRIVLPEEVEELAIEEGKDYCTLITCTPYGINTHRILVRGRRIENMEGETVVTAEAVRIPDYVVIPAVGIPLLFFVLAAMLLYCRLAGPKKTRQEMLEEIRK